VVVALVAWKLWAVRTSMERMVQSAGSIPAALADKCAASAQSAASKVVTFRDNAKDLWRQRVNTRLPPIDEREVLRRIQREVEGMAKDVAYQQRMCAMCLGDFPSPLQSSSSPSDLVERLACRHRFHSECIHKRPEDGASSACPLCREMVETLTLEEQTSDEKIFKTRLRYYLARLRSEQEAAARPSLMRWLSSRPTLEADVDYLYDNRSGEWDLSSATRKPVKPIRSYTDALPNLPSVGGTLQRGRDVFSAFTGSKGNTNNNNSVRYSTFAIGVFS
jgi:hypothetical protein